MNCLRARRLSAQSCARAANRSDHTRGANPRRARTALWAATMSRAKALGALAGGTPSKRRHCAPPLPASTISIQHVCRMLPYRLSVVRLNLIGIVVLLGLRILLLLIGIVVLLRRLVLLLTGIAVGIRDPGTIPIV